MQLRDHLRHLALIIIFLAIAGAAITCAPTADGEILLQTGITIDEHTIEEIETERLVCAVAYSELGHNIAISCVPKIPGLWAEEVR